MVQLSHPYLTTRKVIRLTIWTFVSQVMSLLSNTLSGLVTAFLPRSKYLLFLWLQSTSAKALAQSMKQSISFFFLFFKFPCFFYDPMNVCNLLFASFAFPKFSLYICKLSIHILLKPSLKDFEHYLTSMWNESNCTIVWTFFGISFLWDWNDNWSFSVLWPLLSFPNLLIYWVQD